MRKLFLLCLIMLISVTTMAEGYSGKIISGNKLQGLADATIQLFNNNVFVGGCKSKTDGSFSVNTSQRQQEFLSAMWDLSLIPERIVSDFLRTWV